MFLTENYLSPMTDDHYFLFSHKKRQQNALTSPDMPRTGKKGISIAINR